MKKLLLLGLIGLALNAQAQDKIEFNQSVTCDDVKLPDVSVRIEKDTPVINYKIELKDNKKNLSEFSLSTFPNVYTPFSQLQTITYIGSVKTVKNPTKDAVELEKNPYITEIEPKQLSTGMNFIVYPKIDSANNVVTTLCFNKSELLGMKQASVSSIPTPIELPETKSIKMLKDIILVPGKTTTLDIDKNVSLKITATVEKKTSI